MKKILALWLMALSWTAPLITQAKINIFACEPEWAALALEIGGDKVNIFTATHAKQDPHYIRARPSLIAKARQAHFIICSGAGLEAGWLPILQQKASAHVKAGAEGYLMAADYVPILEKPLTLDRSMGDIHPEGNPHVHLNPHNILLVSRELAKRLAVIDDSHAAFYQAKLQDFITRWQRAIVRWEKAAAHLKGARVVVHHQSFSYMLDWLQLKQAAKLEPKPGIPPTSSHLAVLLQKLKANPARVIIRTPYDPDNASKWLSAKTNIPALVLPYTIDGDAKSGDLFALFDRSIALLKSVINDK